MTDENNANATEIEIIGLCPTCQGEFLSPALRRRVEAAIVLELQDYFLGTIVESLVLHEASAIAAFALARLSPPSS